MIFALASKFHVYIFTMFTYLESYRILNVNALVGDFNQEKALDRRGLLCDCEIFSNICLQL